MKTIIFYYLVLLVSLLFSCKQEKKTPNDKPVFVIINDDSITESQKPNYKVDFLKKNNGLFKIAPNRYENLSNNYDIPSAIFDSSKKEFAKIGNTKLFHDKFTISIWIKPDVNKKDMHPIINRAINNEFKKPYYQFFLALRGEAYEENPFSFFGWFSFNDKLVSLSSLMNWQPGNWYNLVVTFDGELIKFFINGKLQDQEYVSGSINPSNQDIILAKHCNFDYYYKGNIGEFKVYDTALSQDDIIFLYE